MIISIYRCCGPQKIEKILINHKKKKNVNTNCDFRQFRLNSKSYNFAFCVFFVFLTDRKCRPLSSFSKSDGFGWARNVIYERQNLTEVFGFWFQLWSRSGSINCSRIRGVPFVLPYRKYTPKTSFLSFLAPQAKILRIFTSFLSDFAVKNDDFQR